MNSAMKLGVVLLAAGRSERFGSNKLLADFCGKPMICRALEAMHAVSCEQSCVVTGCSEIADLARAYGCGVIWNDSPQLGQSHSICLGVSAMADMDAVLLLAGDQPRLTGESLVRMISSFRASDKGMACLRDETHMGNPAVFSKAYFSALTALSGDRGAKGILRAHENDLLVVSCLNQGELADADTPQALAAVQQADGN